MFIFTSKIVKAQDTNYTAPDKIGAQRNIFLKCSKINFYLPGCKEHCSKFMDKQEIKTEASTREARRSAANNAGA